MVKNSFGVLEEQSMFVFTKGCHTNEILRFKTTTHIVADKRWSRQDHNEGLKNKSYLNDKASVDVNIL